MEEGETALDAAHREFAEETGVVLPEGTLRHWRDLAVRHAGREDDDRVHLFLAPTDLTDTDVTCMEGRQILFVDPATVPGRSEEHTSELQSLMRNSYAVFCLKKKQTKSTQEREN